MSNGHFSADSPQKSVSSRRIVTVAVICVLVLALAAVGFFLVRPALDPYHCRMADGVSIAGVDVGGMTKGEARKALQAALDETLYQENLTVALPMESITLSPADTGVQVDVRAAVNDAYRMGRSGGSLPGNMDLRPYLSVNSEFIRTALEGYASEFDTEFSDSHYTLTGDAPDLGTENHDPSAPCQTLDSGSRSPPFQKASTSCTRCSMGLPRSSKTGRRPARAKARAANSPAGPLPTTTGGKVETRVT